MLSKVKSPAEGEARQRRQKSKVFNGGFTLIEMLIVISIIAILSSVFLVGLRGFRGGAYDSRRISDLQKIQSYLEIYYNAKSRTYPTGLSGDWGTFQAKLKEVSSLDSVPNDPLSSSGRSYIYCSEDGQSYVLAAELSTNQHSALKESYHPASTPTGCTTKGSGNSTFSCGTDTSPTAWLCVKF